MVPDPCLILPNSLFSSTKNMRQIWERSTQMLAKLICAANRHASRSGHPTAIPQLTIWSTQAPTDQIPALFEPEFYLLLQGAKRMMIAGKTFECRAGTCAVASVGLPFTSQVIEASPDQPYLGLELRLDASVISGLLLNMSDCADQQSGAITIARADDIMLEPLERLIRLLDEPSEIPVLAPQFEREFCYRLLQGPMGSRLRQIGSCSARFGQIRTAAQWICENANKPMSVERLAASVGMSVTSFHRHFKAVTAQSPLAYQRQIRLLDARRMLASGSINVTATAFATGYASASQFSREYKRAYGVAPIRDAALPRQQ
jgi:AraC-like DNA-binding protein